MQLKKSKFTFLYIINTAKQTNKYTVTLTILYMEVLIQKIGVMKLYELLIIFKLIKRETNKKMEKITNFTNLHLFINFML